MVGRAKSTIVQYISTFVWYISRRLTTDTKSLSVRWQFGDNLSLNNHWQLWHPLIAETETIELVAFIGLEGVNYVFSHVSLILVATFSFRVFANSLLTNFFAPLMAAWNEIYRPVSCTIGTPS